MGKSNTTWEYDCISQTFFLTDTEGEVIKEVPAGLEEYSEFMRNSMRDIVLDRPDGSQDHTMSWEELEESYNNRLYFDEFEDYITNK